MKKSYFIMMLQKTIDAHIENDTEDEKIRYSDVESLTERIDIFLHDLGMTPPFGWDED